VVASLDVHQLCFVEELVTVAVVVSEHHVGNKLAPWNPRRRQFSMHKIQMLRQKSQQYQQVA
jgi:hypothetical protein